MAVLLSITHIRSGLHPLFPTALGLPREKHEVLPKESPKMEITGGKGYMSSLFRVTSCSFASQDYLLVGGVSHGEETHPRIIADGVSSLPRDVGDKCWTWGFDSP